MPFRNITKKKVAGETHQGRFPPPLYNTRDEISPMQYPSRAGHRSYPTEDIGNYGTGGYYGNTYRQEDFTRGRSHFDYEAGERDSYRRLGDRQWHGDPQTAWDIEHSSRPGYRSIQERMETQQGHRGKGPRSYRRSDERILEDVNNRLYDDPYLNAADIETAVVDGDVTLSGTVDARHAKRRAEDVAESVRGVKNVENRLRVDRVTK